MLNNRKRLAYAAAWVLFVSGGTFALAAPDFQTGRSAGGGLTLPQVIAQIASSSGWTYNGTQSISIGDIAIPTNNFLYLNGASRSVGLTHDGSVIKIQGAGPLTAASDQFNNLGSAAVRWSNAYFGGLRMGTSGALTLDISNPTVAACTGAARSHGNAVSAQYDVGTSCTGVSTIVLTLPAATNGWSCEGWSRTAGKTLLPTGDTTTSCTLTHYTTLGMVAGDFADGEDVVINAKAR